MARFRSGLVEKPGFGTGRVRKSKGATNDISLLEAPFCYRYAEDPRHPLDYFSIIRDLRDAIALGGAGNPR